MAMSGAVNIIMSLVFIGLSFWALQAFRFDLFLKNPKGGKAKLLQILLSIMIGGAVASFFSEYYGWTKMLQQISQQ
ncbi:DUF1146 family protein [Aneurinibacillus sp. Ricciae_BoGa-3]|uniref:DUF1146 family protein n=1 Tax=Aneurinibacillus sp. Ricciae_BoGa-3 TaxID=3022697 RepID=UPI002340EC51|nr:DUF1146 family protein [Aneurinibacillus sp. Ricciae_BoGa-3]WCK54329.1 DUF1146 family protein [Aneurinibacillus sp. Ricciae_BoGa-3]